ncbi:MAG: dephospho-CoA kinase [Alphaproteobacteria bacterium]|nr:dephospho-CoA kinase [Alphaproteobacteria bacterium]
MKIIGITGSIGCGKTYLANIIKKMGYSVYNPDKWVRGLYKNKQFLDVIKQNFPTTFENGVFNKRSLRNLVFGDNNELHKLENIIHPFLKRKIKYYIHKFSRKSEFIFFDAALLFEKNWDIYCDYIIVADIDEETQKQRVIKRDNITETDFYKIMKVQIPQSEKRKYADYIINTGQSENINKIQIIRIMDEII